MTLHGSCRVRTADRVAQPRKRWSAVRTLQNAKRVFTQGHLGADESLYIPEKIETSPPTELLSLMTDRIPLLEDEINELALKTEPGLLGGKLKLSMSLPAAGAPSVGKAVLVEAV